MPEKNRQYKRYIVPRLRFPTSLSFKTHNKNQLICNGKTVQIVASEMVMPKDNPPVNFAINGIGKFSFSLTGADVYIFHFANVRDNQADCAIIGKDELIDRLKSYHYNGDDKINLKLILSERGLHECFGCGAEGFFMALWLDELRDFTDMHNNWWVFKT